MLARYVRWFSVIVVFVVAILVACYELLLVPLSVNDWVTVVLIIIGGICMVTMIITTLGVGNEFTIDIAIVMVTVVSILTVLFVALSENNYSFNPDYVEVIDNETTFDNSIMRFNPYTYHGRVSRDFEGQYSLEAGVNSVFKSAFQVKTNDGKTSARTTVSFGELTLASEKDAIRLVTNHEVPDEYVRKMIREKALASFKKTVDSFELSEPVNQDVDFTERFREFMKPEELFEDLGLKWDGKMEFKEITITHTLVSESD